MWPCVRTCDSLPQKTLPIFNVAYTYEGANWYGPDMSLPDLRKSETAKGRISVVEFNSTPQDVLHPIGLIPLVALTKCENVRNRSKRE